MKSLIAEIAELKRMVHWHMVDEHGYAPWDFDDLKPDSVTKEGDELIKVWLRPDGNHWTLSETIQKRNK